MNQATSPAFDGDRQEPPMQPLQLRPYQADSVERLRDGFRPLVRARAGSWNT
jgi:hypothetical protein